MAATTYALVRKPLERASRLEQIPGLQAVEAGRPEPDPAVHTDPSESAENAVDWPELVSRIHRGDESGMEDLYRIFARGIRFYLCRQLGPQELDDKVHDTFLIVVQAIRRGDLREPERLMGFVRTVVRRQVAAHIDHVVHSRREELHLDVGIRVADGRHNPEQSAAFRQKMEFMRGVLGDSPNGIARCLLASTCMNRARNKSAAR